MRIDIKYKGGEAVSFGKELSHLIEEQISKAFEDKSISTDAAGAISRSGVDEGLSAIGCNCLMHH